MTALVEKSSLRVCIVSEGVAGPLDEGRKKLVIHLVQSLETRCQVMGISIDHGKPPARLMTEIPTNRLLLSMRLRTELRKFHPQIICYAPFSSLTTTGFIRCAVLRAFQPKASLVAINMQPRLHNSLIRWLPRRFRPDLVFAQESSTLDYLSSRGYETRFLPSGVELERFRPVAPEKKEALQSKYGISTSKVIVLHVGHIRSARDVRLLKRLPEECQGLLVGGTPMEQEQAVARELRQSGVIVVDDYLERVEEVYQLADCYLFPVKSSDASIGVPLSVLEAMACNLPVVTYPFGGLPLLFKGGEGLFYASDEEGLLRALKSASQNSCVRTREMVASLSWDHIADRFIADLKSLLSTEDSSGAELIRDEGRG